jgi:hypothetical protein
LPSRNDTIELDGLGAVGRLREYGSQLARLIDWEAFLDGTDERSASALTRSAFPNVLRRKC